MLDAVLASLREASRYNRSDQVAPAVVLWTDKERQWEPLLPRLRSSIPQLLTLGAYDPSISAGPAIWIKCMIARALPEAGWPDDVTPILYLPGVSRQELRAVEECPRHLQPLAELQYRGLYWSQVSSRDWTLLAFLQSNDGGLGLDVARDAATIESMHRAILKLSETSVGDLRGRRLEGADFNALLTPDPVRDLLVWMDDPSGARRRWDEATWESFRSICRERYDFDPHTEGELTGAERLGRGSGAWKEVWSRFAEAPARYPGLPELLRRARPAQPDDLFLKSASPVWPQDNEALELELRNALADLKDSVPAEAAKKIAELEGQHGARRGWVWAALGQARLARALRHIKELSEVTKTALNGTTPDEMGRAYTEGGWRADEAVIEALGAVKTTADMEAVKAAIRVVYGPWLEQAALRFQELVKRHPLPANEQVVEEGDYYKSPEKGCVILFADGLRYDTAQKFKALMNARGWNVAESWHWVALPSVTATAKPAVSPISDLLNADTEAGEFCPFVAATNQPLTIDRFRQLMVGRGYQILSAGETGNPSGAAWTEVGDLDKYGHNHGWKLAWRVAEVLDEMTERLAVLLEAGWKKVRIVTDHGWLLYPGGLPKSEMSKHLAETRWGRCAVLKDTSVVESQVVAWHWSPHIRIAVAPGINVFKKGLEYAHGGLSVQECVAAVLTVTGRGEVGSQATITAVEWFGLRCRVHVRGAGDGLLVGLRTKAADASTSIAEAKGVNDGGPTALFVGDDSLDGAAAVAVLVAPDGRVVAKLPTTVGE